MVSNHDPEMRTAKAVGRAKLCKARLPKPENYVVVARCNKRQGGKQSTSRDMYLDFSFYDYVSYEENAAHQMTVWRFAQRW
jgi:hypothetical protein